MYEQEMHRDFTPTIAFGTRTVVEMVRASINILNDPHAPQALKDRQLSIILHIKQLIDSYQEPKK